MAKIKHPYKGTQLKLITTEPIQPKRSQWVSTATAAKQLGVSVKFLLKHRGDLFKQRKHWKNINPHAWRPTYRWHVANCEKAMDGEDLPKPKLCDS